MLPRWPALSLSSLFTECLRSPLELTAAQNIGPQTRVCSSSGLCSAGWWQLTLLHIQIYTPTWAFRSNNQFFELLEGFGFWIRNIIFSSDVQCSAGVVWSNAATKSLDIYWRYYHLWRNYLRQSSIYCCQNLSLAAFPGLQSRKSRKALPSSAEVAGLTIEKLLLINIQIWTK